MIYIPCFQSMATRNPIEMPVRARARACVQVDMVTRFPLVPVLVRLDDFGGAKKKTVLSDLIPNNYEEQPELIEGKTRVFKDKVAARVDDLDNLGKFVTLFQVKIARSFF